MAASLQGLDVLVFTGGVGEHAAEVRARAASALAWLGIALDSRHNAAAAGDREIGHEGADARVLVIRAREDVEIARQVRALLARS
jgi:acetate kinase